MTKTPGIRFLLAAFLGLFLAAVPWPSFLGELLSPPPLPASSRAPPPRLFDRRLLSRYDGDAGSRGLYLSVLGQVFDVAEGRRHYGPGGAYAFFAGKDASRAFVTGDFTEGGLTDDLSGVSPSQVVALYDWLAFYQRHYTSVGRLIGRYYGETGQPTEALKHLEATLAEGLKLRAEAEADRQRFPPCNSEWSSSGGRVWCSTKSGGVHRSWAGVPRKMFSPGSRSSRCVCIPMDEPMPKASPNLQEYEDCPTFAESCSVQNV